MRVKRSSGVAGALLVSALLALSAPLLSSCGKKAEQKGNGAGAPETDVQVQVNIEDASDIDELVKELDSAMDSLSDDEFDPQQLDEGELGWR